MQTTPDKSEIAIEVKPGKTATLIFNDEEFLNKLDKFYIRTLSWNLGDNKSTLYMSNLRIKKA